MDKLLDMFKSPMRLSKDELVTALKLLDKLIIEEKIIDAEIIKKIFINVQYNFNELEDKNMLEQYLINIFNCKQKFLKNSYIVVVLISVLNGKHEMMKYIFDILVKINFVFTPEISVTILNSRNTEVKINLFNGYSQLVPITDVVLETVISYNSEKCFTNFLSSNICKLSQEKVKQTIINYDFHNIETLSNCGYNFTIEMLELACKTRMNYDCKYKIVKILLAHKLIPTKECWKSIIDNNYGYGNYHSKYTGQPKDKLIELLLNFGYVPTYDDVLFATSKFVVVHEIEKYGIELDDKFFTVCIKNNFYPFTYDKEHATQICLQLECCKRGTLTKIKELIKIGKLKFDYTCLKNACNIRNNLPIIRYILDNSDLKLNYELAQIILDLSGNMTTKYVVEKVFDLNKLVIKEKNEKTNVSNNEIGIGTNNMDDIKTSKKAVSKDIDSDDGDPIEPEPEIYKKKKDIDDEPKIVEKQESIKLVDIKPKKIKKVIKKKTKLIQISDEPIKEEPIEPKEIILNKNPKIIIKKIIKKEQEQLKELPKSFNYREKMEINPNLSKLLKIRSKKTFVELRKIFMKYLVENKYIDKNIITIPREINKVLTNKTEIINMNLENLDRLLYYISITHD
jgi:hypothetical protein